MDLICPTTFTNVYLVSSEFGFTDSPLERGGTNINVVLLSCGVRGNGLLLITLMLQSNYVYRV